MAATKGPDHLTAEALLLAIVACDCAGMEARRSRAVDKAARWLDSLSPDGRAVPEPRQEPREAVTALADALSGAMGEAEERRRQHQQLLGSSAAPPEWLEKAHRAVKLYVDAFVNPATPEQEAAETGGWMPGPPPTDVAGPWRAWIESDSCDGREVEVVSDVRGDGSFIVRRFTPQEVGGLWETTDLPKTWRIVAYRPAPSGPPEPEAGEGCNEPCDA